MQEVHKLRPAFGSCLWSYLQKNVREGDQDIGLEGDTQAL